MTPRAAALIVVTVLAFGSGREALAQEGTWSLSASSGIALLRFDDVDEDGRQDIAAYNNLGIPIGNYPVLRTAPVVQAAVQYRFDRDMGISLFGSYQQARTATSMRDSLERLSLDRRLTSVLLGTDIAYFFPPLVGGLEVSLFVGLAYLWATADQTTAEWHTVKVGTTTEQHVVQDAYAKYRKTKLNVRAGATLTVPVLSSASLLAGVAYLHAPLGSMTGTLREFDLVRPHETAVQFNYSALQFTLGAVYSF